MTFSYVLLVVVDILFVADILFVVGEVIRFLTSSAPACGEAIWFLTVSIPTWRLSGNFDTSCNGPFSIYFWVYRCITNTKKDSFKWRKFLYWTQAIHSKLRKSLARNHQIFKSPGLLIFGPYLSLIRANYNQV